MLGAAFYDSPFPDDLWISLLSTDKKINSGDWHGGIDIDIENGTNKDYCLYVIFVWTDGMSVVVPLRQSADGHGEKSTVNFWPTENGKKVKAVVQHPDDLLASLTVQKTVTGDGAGPSQEFDFTVDFAGEHLEHISYKIIDLDGKGDDKIKAEVAAPVPSIIAGSISFTLKHHYAVTFSGVTAGVTYTVTEAPAEDYTVNQPGGQYTGVAAQKKNDNITFVNHYEAPEDPSPSPEDPSPSPEDPSPSPEDPSPSPEDPSPSPADPSPSPADPAPSPEDPSPSPTEPTPSPTEPEPSPGEPSPSPTVPEPSPTEPEPEPTPTEPEPPEPTTPEPEPEPGAPTPPEPEPAPEPEPEPELELEPGAPGAPPVLEPAPPPNITFPDGFDPDSFPDFDFNGRQPDPSAPGGTDPNAPPVPANPDSTLLAAVDGDELFFIELDAEDVPLGEWHYDDGEWVFLDDEYVPLDGLDMPVTGDTPAWMFLCFALGLYLVALGVKRQLTANM